MSYGNWHEVPWLTGWKFRRRIEITWQTRWNDVPSELHDYAWERVVDWTSDMHTQFKDLRLTHADGTTLLSSGSWYIMDMIQQDKCTVVLQPYAVNLEFVGTLEFYDFIWNSDIVGFRPENQNDLYEGVVWLYWGNNAISDSPADTDDTSLYAFADLCNDNSVDTGKWTKSDAGHDITEAGSDYLQCKNDNEYVNCHVYGGTTFGPGQELTFRVLMTSEDAQQFWNYRRMFVGLSSHTQPQSDGNAIGLMGVGNQSAATTFNAFVRTVGTIETSSVSSAYGTDDEWITMRFRWFSGQVDAYARNKTTGKWVLLGSFTGSEVPSASTLYPYIMCFGWSYTRTWAVRVDYIKVQSIPDDPDAMPTDSDGGVQTQCELVPGMPGLLDLVIDQGQELRETIYYWDNANDPIDNTGYTAKAEFRKNKEDASPVLTLQTSDSTITLGGADGAFNLLATADTIRALDFDRGFWSLEFSPSGAADLNTATDTDVLCEGVVVLEKEATK